MASGQDPPRASGQLRGFAACPDELRTVNWQSEVTEYLNATQAREKFTEMPTANPETEGARKLYIIIVVNEAVNVITIVSETNREYLSRPSAMALVRREIIPDRPGLVSSGNTTFEFADEQVRKMPSLNVLDMILGILGTYKNRTLPLEYNSQVCPGAVAALFRCFNNFGDTYSDYLQFPDDGVTITPTAIGYYDLLPNEVRFSKSELQVIAFMVALCLNKSLINQNQYIQVMKKRVSAIKHALSAETVNVATIQTALPLTLLRDVHEKMSFYPRLKREIFVFLLTETEGAIQEHMRLIFRESQLSIFTLIHQFVYSGIKTAAHIDSRVMMDLMVWIPVFKALFDRYGDCWQFYKLYEPAGTMTALNKWPTLGSAAVCHAIVHKSSTYAFLKGGFANKRMIDLVARELKPQYVEEILQRNLSPFNFKWITEECGIKEIGVDYVPGDVSDFKQELAAGALDVVMRAASGENDD